MLILTRSSGESLRIGDDVIIKVLANNGAQIKLGIEAPRSVAVNRAEVYDKPHSYQDVIPSDIIFNDESA